MPERINEVPEFQPETGPVNSAKIDTSDKEVQERAQRAMNAGKSQIPLTENGKKGETTSQKEGWSKTKKAAVIGGSILAASGVVEGTTGAVSSAADAVKDHFTETVDSLEHLEYLRDNNPEAYENTVINRTIKKMGNEAWNNISTEEKEIAKAKTREEDEANFKERSRVRIDSDGSMKAHIDDTTYRSDLG